MARVTTLLIVALFVTSGAASAQVAMGAAPAPGVRFSPPVLTSPPPPSRPEPPPPPPPHHHHGPQFHDPAPLPGEDLFRARPDTYRIRKNPLFIRRADFYPSYAVPYVTPQVIEQPVIVERTKVIVVEREETASRNRDNADAQAAAEAPLPVMVGVRKTVYVIPRCYAGDKPPDVSRLPAECDIREMKIIP